MFWPSPQRLFLPPLYRAEEAMVLCTHARRPRRRLSPCRSSGHSRRWIRRLPTTWTNPNPQLSPCWPSFSKICSSPSYCRRHRIDPVATGLPSSRQDVQELLHRLLLRPRLRARARRAGTLDIEHIFVGTSPVSDVVCRGSGPPPASPTTSSSSR